MLTFFFFFFLFRLTCSVVLWGGRNTANTCHWYVWGALAVSGPHWVCLHSWRVRFHGLHCSGSRSLCRELSEVGPALSARPRSKPLRFRFSGSPLRCRLDWACILCPSPVQAAQVTRCLASAVTPGVGSSYHVPVSAARFPGWQRACSAQVCRVSPLGS